MIAGRSPPGPTRCGSTTCKTKPAATAASKALPPRSRMLIPTLEAIQCVVVTTPKFPWISGRVVKGVMEYRSGLAGIERIAQAVAHQVEAHHDQEDSRSGPDGHPWSLGQEVLGDIEHRAPARRRRLLTEAEEREAGLGDDRGSDGQGRLHENRREDIGEDVAQHDAGVSQPDRTSAFNVVLRLDRK